MIEVLEKLFLRSLLDSLPESVFFKDTESRFMAVNRALAARLGLNDPSEAIGKTDFDFFKHPHAFQARNDELEILRTGTPLIAKEELELSENAPPCWVLTTKMPFYDNSGKIIGTFGISKDISDVKAAEDKLRESQDKLLRHHQQLEELVRHRTDELSAANKLLAQEIEERKVAEQSLRTSEDRYRRLIEVNPTYIYTVTLRKGYPITTEHGRGCVAVTGYTPEDYRSNPNLWIVMVHPEDRDLVKKFATEDLAQKNYQNQIEHRIIHKDGRVRWVRNTIVHHYNDSGELERYDGLVEDITSRKNIDERQRENERLRAVISMAKGVASNYSDIVDEISGHAESISRRVPKSSILFEHAASILDALSHASGLNNRLSAAAHAYSQDSSAKEFLKSVEIRKVVNRAIRSVKRLLSKQNISIKTFIPSDIPPVAANAEQLLDTLKNMLVNSVEAMPGEGSITITASSKRILKDSHRWNQTAKGGTYVVLRVADTGIGMDSETQKQVFEPFFSAKKERGFGLGLAMAQAAVKSWGGWILVRSKAGHGTVFRIFMPVAAKGKTDTDESPAKPAITLKGKTAIVIDDNTDLAKNVAATLESDGMHVVMAHSDADAINHLTEHIDRVSLFVVDMVLKNSDWKHVVERIYDLKPDANVIIMSGFSREFVRANMPVGAWSFIQKPFEQHSLLQLAGDILSRDM